MPTRHASSQIPYPFEEPAAFATREILAGILDAYFIVQGDPTGTSAGDRAYPYVKLISIAIAGVNYRYTFDVVADGNLWTVWFDLPTTGGMGQIANGDATDCQAVLIFDTDLLYSGAGTAMAEYIEPSRTEWHTEQLEELNALNIARVNGVEDDSILIPVVEYVGGEIALEDGYNVELVYNEATGNLEITAATALGKGRDPGFGDTGSGSSNGSSSAGPGVQDYVSVINGIAPRSGDILVEVSKSLGINRSPGRLEIVVKQ